MGKTKQKVVLAQLPENLSEMTDEEIDAWSKTAHTGFVKATPKKDRPGS